MNTRRLRIAMLSVHSSPLGELGTRDTGGMSVYIRELAVALGRQGHLVDMYTRQNHPAASQCTAIAENVSLIHIPAGTSGHIDKLALYPHLPEFFAQMELFRRRENRSYDIIHSNYWLSGRVGHWAQLHWQKPHFVLFHTLGAVKNLFPVGSPEPQLRIATENFVGRRCSRILAETERESMQLTQLYGVPPDKISVIPCGTDFALFSPQDTAAARNKLGIGSSDTILLYVGRLDPLKGVDRLITALARLKHLQHLRLLIVGGDGRETAESRRLKDLSQSLGLENTVAFTGRVDHSDLPDYYSAADILVLPSHTESFGLVGLESLACGTPVLSTRVGAMDRIIESGKTGFLVPDADPRSLAEGLELSIPHIRAGFLSRAAIRASVLHFSWGTVAAAMAEEYETAIRRACFWCIPEARDRIAAYSA
jgi:D-inositol-3-phosphate glycosyltransferase